MLLALSLLVASHRAEDTDDTWAETAGSQPKSARKKSKKDDAYDLADLGFGNSEDEALNEYGVILNDFNQEEMIAQDHLTLLYTTDSSQFKEGNNIASNIHHSVMKPALKELKGLGRFYVFDCQHPVMQSQKELEQGIAGSCNEEKNPQKMPSLMLFRQPETRINPYTGKPMQKSQVPY